MRRRSLAYTRSSREFVAHQCSGAHGCQALGLPSGSFSSSGSLFGSHRGCFVSAFRKGSGRKNADPPVVRRMLNSMTHMSQMAPGYQAWVCARFVRLQSPEPAL